LEAADALGIDPGRIAKTMICRWKLSPLGTWAPVTVFVPGNADIDFLMLQSTLGVAVIEPVSRRDVQALTGFQPGAMPPVFLPAVVDQRLLTLPAADGNGVFVSGLTERGLYRLFLDADGHQTVRGIFRHLLGEFDEFQADEGDNGNSSSVLTPIFEPMMGAILTDDLAGDQGTKRHLWRGLFNWTKDLSRDAEEDIGYWMRRKEAGGDLREAGDNRFFGRFCSHLLAQWRNAATDDDKLRVFLAGTNLMLVVRAASMTRMVFPLAITTYDRSFFPFVPRQPQLDRWCFYDVWGHDSPAGFAKAVFEGHREHLRYCRLTQYTQVDISFVGDPRRGSHSQTGRALREGRLYCSWPDNVHARKRGLAAGQDVDEDLGIRSLFYLRLFPAGLQDLTGEEQQSSIYLFGVSPFSRWFFDPFPESPPANDVGLLRNERKLGGKAIQADHSHLLLRLSRELQSRVTTLRGPAQLMGDREAAELDKQLYVFDDLRRTARDESQMNIRVMATKTEHRVWWRILLDYDPADCSLRDILEQFRYENGNGIKGDRLSPRMFAVLDSGDDFTVHADSRCVLQLLGMLWKNCDDHGDASTCEIRMGRLAEERAVYLSIVNRLRGGCLDIRSYQRLRQRFPHSPAITSSPTPDVEGSRRGFGLLMVHLAFADRHGRAAAKDQVGERAIWIEYGLKRATLSEGRFAVRPVSQSPDGGIVASDITALRTHWESIIWFDEMR
jgi:hypothetical protein